MTKEELNKIEYVINALDETLSHFIGWNGGGYEAYWETYEEYEEFNQDIADALAIIKKEINNEKNK